VEADTSNWPFLASTIWVGESPRATSGRAAAIIASKSASRALAPRRASESSPSARAWARAAEYSHLHLRVQRRLRQRHPLHTHGHLRSLGHASSGAPSARPPLPGPLATVRLRLTSSDTVAFERPSERAIDLPLSRPSSPRSMATLSALPSLKQGLLPFSSILGSPFPRAPSGGLSGKELAGLVRTCSGECGRKHKVFG